MSYSKKHLSQWRTRGRVIMTYRSSDLTLQSIADRFHISLQTAWKIVQEGIPEIERRALKARRYAASKRGMKNPALGKRPGNYRGDCADGRGYLTRVVRGKRYFAHRIVAAEMLGLLVENLPSSLHVHHIDGVKDNNCPDNLAIVTSAGHRRLHSN